MPLLKLNSLGAQNINFDLEPCDLPANTLTSGTNYKLLNGKIRATNMSYTLATPSANFKAGLIMSVLGQSGNFYLLMGQSSTGAQVAWAYNGTSWTDISQVGAYTGISSGGELNWTGCLLGNIPIVNNVQDYPAYWSPQQTAQKLQPLNFGSSSTLNITNYIGAGTTTVTGTVTSTYGYSIGDTLTISGATGTEQTKLNGVWSIASVPTSTTFTFVVTTSVAAGTLAIINYIGAGTTTVTGTIASTAGYSIGDTLTISGATGTEQVKLNGTWTIANVPTSTTFTFVVTTSVAAGTLTTTLGTTKTDKLTTALGVANKSGQTWKSKGLNAKIVRSHKNFLFALNLQQSATVLATSYRWSHPADINGLPYTWDETDLAAIAGIASVGGDMGDLVDGMTLRDNFMLYSQRGISSLSYVGGEFVWASNVLTTSYGLLAKNCVVESKGYHYFLSNGDILKTDGNSLVSVLHNQMQTQLVGNIDPIYYMNSFAFANPITEEIWFCIPQAGHTLPNIAFVINTQDDLVSMRSIPNTTTGLNFGPNLQIPILWSNVLGGWDENANNWTYDPTSIFSRTIVSTNNVNSAIISLELDDLNTTQNTLLERLSFPVEGKEVVTTTQSVFPQITSQAPVLIQLGSQQFVAGPIAWKPPVSFDPNTMRKVDIRTTGKLLSWRIYSTGTLPFTLTGLDIQYVVNGLR